MALFKFMNKTLKIFYKFVIFNNTAYETFFDGLLLGAPVKTIKPGG